MSCRPDSMKGELIHVAIRKTTYIVDARMCHYHSDVHCNSFALGLRFCTSCCDRIYTGRTLLQQGHRMVRV